MKNITRQQFEAACKLVGEFAAQQGAAADAGQHTAKRNAVVGAAVVAITGASHQVEVTLVQPVTPVKVTVGAVAAAKAAAKKEAALKASK